MVSQSILLNKKITYKKKILKNLLRTFIIRRFLRSFRKNTHSNKNRIKGEYIKTY